MSENNPKFENAFSLHYYTSEFVYELKNFTLWRCFPTFLRSADFYIIKPGEPFSSLNVNEIFKTPWSFFARRIMDRKKMIICSSGTLLRRVKVSCIKPNAIKLWPVGRNTHTVADLRGGGSKRSGPPSDTDLQGREYVACKNKFFSAAKKRKI